MQHIIPESSVFIRSLGWSLVHSLWQGAFIAAGLWLLLRVLQAAPARIRYHLRLASLVLLPVWFGLTWAQQWQRLQAVTVHVTAAARDSGVEQSYTVTALPAQGGSGQWLYHLLQHMEPSFPVIIALYLAGLFLMLLRFSLGFGRLLQIRYTGIGPADACWTDRLQQLKDRLLITGTVKLLISTRIDMPLTFGVLKPLILLPAAMITRMSTDQVEAILLHELAHIRRQDYLINIFQIIIETVLFFNPFMWWISAGIRREREHCCDDLVLSQTRQPLPYATALAALEAFRSSAQPMALAAGGQQHYLFNRIKRMTEMKKHPLNYGRLAAALVIAGTLTFSVIWFSPAVAQGRKAKTAARASTTQRIVIIDEKGNRKEYNSIDELPEPEKERLRKTLQAVPGLPGGARATEVTEDEYHDWTGKHLGQTAAPEPPVAPLPPEPPAAPDPDRKAVSDALQEASKAMAAIDWKALDKTTQDALKQADKAILRANASLKNIDWETLDRQIEEAAREIDAIDREAVGNAEGEGESARLHQKAMKGAAADARRITVVHRRIRQEEAAEARREAADARRDVLDAARDARRDALDARQEAEDARRDVLDAARDAAAEKKSAAMAEEGRQLMKEMEQEGLVKATDGYIIEKKRQGLYINGKMAPEEVADRYRHYFHGGNIRIEASGNRYRGKKQTFKCL